MTADERDDAHRRSVGLASTLGLVVGIVLAVTALVARLGLVGVLLGTVIGAGAARLAFVRSTQLVVRGFGGEPLVAGARPRLESLVDGLSIVSGVPRPRIEIVDTDATNVVVAAHDTRSATLVLTRGLLDALNRVELEGVLAHAMARLDRGATRVATVAVATVGLPALLAERWMGRGGGVALVARLLTPLAAASAWAVGRSVDPDLGLEADLASIRLTRFPPGLADALAALEGRDAALAGSTSLLAPLHVLDPDPVDRAVLAAVARRLPPHRPLDQRVELLREL